MRQWVIAVLFATLTACSGSQQESAQAEFIGTDITGANFGNPLALTDHRGQVRSLADFQGRVVALFFGYTNCPDVCPTTLDDLSKAVKLLGERKPEVQVLFVTLDPGRDTQEKLAQYVPAFDEGFVGLRGDEAETRKVASDFKVFYKLQDSGSKSGYTVDHSAGVYLFDRQGNLRVYLSHGQKPQDIAHDMDILLN